MLGLSAGLKHFGKRRLGRSGLDDPDDVSDNVWAVDCTQFFRNVDNIRSAYFDVRQTQRLMRQVLKGIDRHVLIDALRLEKTSTH